MRSQVPESGGKLTRQVRHTAKPDFKHSPNKHANEVNGEYNAEGAFRLVSMSEPPIPVRRHEQYAIRMSILVPLPQGGG